MVMLVLVGFRRLKQKDHEFKVSLAYIGRHCLIKTNEKNENRAIKVAHWPKAPAAEPDETHRTEGEKQLRPSVC